MSKRMLMLLGMALVFMMGIAALTATIQGASAHPAVGTSTNSSSVQAPPAGTQEATEVAGEQPDSATDADANTPCATDPKTGEQTGNCEDAPGSPGHEDTGAAAQGNDSGQSGQ